MPVIITCAVVSLGFITLMMKLVFGMEQMTVIASNLDPIRKFLAVPELMRPQKTTSLSGSAFSFEDVSFAYNQK